MWLVPSLIRLDFAAAQGCLKKQPALAANTSAGEPSLRVSLSGKVTPRPFSWRGWKKRAWSHALFGAAICETSMGSRFADWWTSSLRDCHASPIQSRASSAATKTSGATGKTATDQSRTPCESLESVSPPWSSSKTSLPGFQEDGFDLSEKNYAEWVTHSQSLSSSLLRRLARATAGSASLSWPTPYGLAGEHGPDGNEFSTAVRQWPTPDANAFGSGMTPETQDQRVANLKEKFAGQNGNGAGKLLAVEVQRWPSPRSEDSESCGNHPGATDSLTGAISLWATPRNNTGPSPPTDKHSSLDGEAAAWSTPAASDGQRGTSPYSEAEINRAQGKPMTLAKDVAAWGTPLGSYRAADPCPVDHGIQLANQVDLWATPMAADDGNKVTPATRMGLLPQVAAWPTPNSRDHKGTDLPSRNGGASLSHATETGVFTHSSPQVPVISTGGVELSPTALSTSERRRLNPAFVCWLQGWPWWWTRAEPINFAAEEMALWRRRQRSLLLSLCGESESERAA